MKKCTLFILFILITAGRSETASFNDKLTITEQQIRAVLQMRDNSVRIEDAVAFASQEPTTELSFLINKTVRNLKVSIGDIELHHRLNPKIDIEKFIGKTESSLIKEYDEAAELTIFLPEPLSSGVVQLDYELITADSVNQAAFSREYVAYEVKGFIGKKGVFLSPSYFWYPIIPDNLSKFDVLAVTPDSIHVITQGKRILNELDEGKRISNWKIDYPAGGVHLIAANFEIKENNQDNIPVYTYFFPESQELAPSYLSASQRYIKMYEELIGPYPFNKFAVVENFFPTGYGMPSYTLLGSQVIRLPFIIYTSLGHEVAHNWWGNSVYVDYENGNWCEGLTTYFADHYYKEMQSEEEAVQYRRDLNRDFSVYVNQENDFPLSQFTERTESASRAIGYGKSAMVFHQLRNIIGDSLFYQSFQKFYLDNKFREASWSDIQFAVEQVYQQDLSWFFDQWIHRPYAPSITLSEVHYGNDYLSFTLSQSDHIYRLRVPIQVVLHDSSLLPYQVWLEKNSQTFNIEIPQQPLTLTVDPHYDICRILSREEIPPTLSEIYAKSQATIVLPDNCTPEKFDAYQKFAQSMSEGKESLTIKNPDQLSAKSPALNSLYVLGTPLENSIYEKLQLAPHGQYSILKDQLILMEDKVPGPDEVVLLVSRSKNDIDQNFCFIAMGANNKSGRVASLMSHYGKYSYLVFENGKNVEKGIYTVQDSPLAFQFNQYE